MEAKITSEKMFDWISSGSFYKDQLRTFKLLLNSCFLQFRDLFTLNHILFGFHGTPAGEYFQLEYKSRVLRSSNRRMFFVKKPLSNLHGENSSFDVPCLPTLCTKLWHLMCLSTFPRSIQIQNQ